MYPLLNDSLALRWDRSSCSFDFVNANDLSWSAADAGTLYGAILVERFRTYGGALIDLSDNRSRLALGALALNIQANAIISDLVANSRRLLDANQDLVRQLGDVSIVVLLSPGIASDSTPLGSSPTCMMHLCELPFPKLARWYRDGCALSSSVHQTVPKQCWPTQMKSRSRLPYFLADLGRNIDGDSLPVLTTIRGTVADTSVANLLLVDQDGKLHSPPKDEILFGATSTAFERMLIAQGIRIQFRDIAMQELFAMSEVILTGSSGGVWRASHLDGIRIGSANVGSRLQLLTDLWTKYVGMNFLAQANTRST